MTTIQIQPGDDWSAPATFRDEAGALINLTGFSVTASIRWEGGSVAVTAAIASPASAGIVNLSMDEAATAQVPMGNVSRLRLRLVSGGGQTTTYYAPVEGLT